MSNSLGPYQDRHSVGPDMDPNCLQRLSADGQKSPLSKERDKGPFHRRGCNDKTNG